MHILIYLNFQEVEGSLSSGMTKEEEEDNDGEIYEYRETSTQINLDLTLS